MSQKIFQFDPSKFAADFARDGYVHIKGGVTPWFHGEVVKQVEESLVNRSMKEYAIGDKKQSRRAMRWRWGWSAGSSHRARMWLRQCAPHAASH